MFPQNREFIHSFLFTLKHLLAETLLFQGVSAIIIYYVKSCNKVQFTTITVKEVILVDYDTCG